MKKLMQLSFPLWGILLTNSFGQTTIAETVPTGTQWVYQDLPSITFTQDMNAPSSPVNGGILNEDYDCGDGKITGSSVDTALNRLCMSMMIKSGSSSTIEIAPNTNNAILEIGSGATPATINQEGISVGGNNLIKKTSDGELHIGKNSWITKEENGKQKVWAKDANGNSIPIDYTNGTKLLINGRDVEQSINNVGALSAALTGLPTVPTDTNLACGLGTGTHGGDFAFSGGCASKVNEKLSINYAASMTMPGQDYAGDFEDTFSARAGFVWKLGKATKPTQISMKETKELKKEIANIKENNKNIIAQNNALLVRLERLEKVALGDLKSKDLAVYPLK